MGANPPPATKKTNVASYRQSHRVRLRPFKPTNRVRVPMAVRDGSSAGRALACQVSGRESDSRPSLAGQSSYNVLVSSHAVLEQSGVLGSLSRTRPRVQIPYAARSSKIGENDARMGNGVNRLTRPLRHYHYLLYSTRICGIIVEPTSKEGAWDCL